MSAYDRLLEYRIKPSVQRIAIMDYLMSHHTHPTADEIYQLLRLELPSISLGTVYRNLNQLSESGEVMKITGLDGSIHFDHNTHKHYHFICNKCNKVYDIPAKAIPNIENSVEECTGLHVSECELVLKGLCRDCQKLN